MKLDWSESATIEDGMVVLQSVPEGFSPRVTIGMPTYKRPDIIRRALASIARQTFRDFILVISDNAGRDPATREAAEEYSNDLPAVILVAQAENQRSLGNYRYLLSVAQSEYFMWLADDDEITENYLEEMVGILDADAGAVTAMGYWQSMKNPQEGDKRIQSRHNQQSVVSRLMRYVAGPTDDSTFYGLHRTASLRQCSFQDYCFPNRGMLSNFCYVFMFDMVLQGRLEHTKSAGWIDHNYSEKHYHVAQALGVKDRVKTLLRRLNVYGLYCAKAFRKNPLLLFPVLLASFYGFFRDIVTALIRISGRTCRRFRYKATANG